MRTGMITESVWNRSVGRQLHNGREDVLLQAAFGGDFSAAAPEEGEAVVLSEAPVT